MILKERTVYVEITEFNENKVPIIPAKFLTYPHTEEPHLLEKWEGYFHTKEELIELLGSVWDEACTQMLNGIQAGFLHPQHQSKFKLSDRELIQAIGETIGNYPIPDNDKYINNLFNTEEYGK